MKNTKLAIVYALLALILVSLGCLSEQPPVDDSNVSSSENGIITYVNVVTNLKPTTQDLFVVRPTVLGTMPAAPTTVNVNLRQVLSGTEYDNVTPGFYLYRLKTVPTVLHEAVQGVDYTVVQTQVN